MFILDDAFLIRPNGLLIDTTRFPCNDAATRKTVRLKREKPSQIGEERMRKSFAPALTHHGY